MAFKHEEQAEDYNQQKIFMQHHHKQLVFDQVDTNTQTNASIMADVHIHVLQNRPCHVHRWMDDQHSIHVTHWVWTASLAT